MTRQKGIDARVGAFPLPLLRYPCVYRKRHPAFQADEIAYSLAMIALLSFLLAVLASPFRSNISLLAENALLRHQDAEASQQSLQPSLEAGKRRLSDDRRVLRPAARSTRNVAVIPPFHSKLYDHRSVPALYRCSHGTGHQIQKFLSLKALSKTRERFRWASGQDDAPCRKREPSAFRSVD
jgi:hypothetical protein